MKIYVAHTSSIDFKNELYKPLRESPLNTQHEFILPHENSSEMYDSKNGLKDCDLVIAEVSEPSTSMGIELGWADLYGVKILAVYKKGTKPSRSLSAVTNLVYEYSSGNELVEIIEKVIKSLLLKLSL